MAIKVFILSNDDLTSNLIFSDLFDSEEIEVAGVAFTTTVIKNKTGLSSVFGLLRKMSFVYWLYLVFTNGCFKVYEKLALLTGHEGSSGHLVSIMLRCRRKGVRIHHAADFNASEFLDILREAAPDLLVIRVNQILGEEILAIPKYGTWCCHSSLLPAYQGIAGEFHALRNEEPAIGTTIFRVELELDKGAPLFQSKLDTDRTSSLFHHMLSNNHHAARLLRESVENFARTHSAPPLAADDAIEPSYHSWPKPPHVHEFRKKGWRLINISEAIKHGWTCLHLPGRWNCFIPTRRNPQSGGKPPHSKGAKGKY